jgi:hypothetical protein
VGVCRRWQVNGLSGNHRYECGEMEHKCHCRHHVAYMTTAVVCAFETQSTGVTLLSGHVVLYSLDQTIRLAFRRKLSDCMQLWREVRDVHGACMCGLSSRYIIVILCLYNVI